MKSLERLRRGQHAQRAASILTSSHSLSDWAKIELAGQTPMELPSSYVLVEPDSW